MIMNLPGFLQKSTDSKQYYFGLFLRGDSAVGFIFEVTGQHVKLIAKELCSYSNGWESVVDDIDELLAILENETGVTVEQTIFFVYSYFIDQESQEIKEPYKAVVKAISKELELKPMGFIECHESVKDLIEKRESHPFNGVIVELDDHHVSIYVYKGGKQIHTDQTARTDEVASDLHELFTRKEEHYLLPSKMIVYGTKNVEADAKIIKDHPWDDDVFIQAPRVQVVKGEELLTGLSTTFIEQLQGGIDKEIVEEEEPPVAVEKSVSTTRSRKSDTVEEAIGGSAVADEEPDEAEKMGFVVGADVTDTDAPLPSKKKASLKMPSFTFQMPQIAMPAFSLKKKGGLVFAALGAVLILAGAISAEYMFHRAVVEVQLPSDSISEDFKLSAGVSNELKNEFTIQKQSNTTQLEKKLATSGEREVGEKAKGTVVINNFEDRALSFSAGTSLTIDGLEFILDSDVTIASASATGDTVSAQKKEATVTAVEIGDEYNISGDKVLSVAGAPSRTTAVAKGTFSGGTKKTLRTIAQRDIQLLDEALEEQSKEADNVKGANADGVVLLEALTESTIDDTNYSGEVGQEASEITASAKANLAYYLFSEEAMRQEIAKRLNDEAPDGYKVDADQITYKIRETKKSGNTVTMQVSTEAVVVKDVNTEEVLNRISGKSIDAATDILRREFEADNIEVQENNSPLFILNGILPFQPKNIELQFKTV